MTEVSNSGFAPVSASGNPDGLRARLVTSPTDKQKLTYTRVEDARTAVARGLREYLEQYSITWRHGRLLRFMSVREVWAEPEEPARYPAASIIGDGAAEYQDAELTPVLIKLDSTNGDGSDRFLKEASELMQMFTVLVWTTDPVERSGLVAMCEDALDPVEFMTGARLELPYYFNARATYEKLSVTYDDSMDDASKRWRKASIQVQANIPQLVPVGDLQIMRTRLDLSVDDPSAGAGGQTGNLEGVTIVGTDIGPFGDDGALGLIEGVDNAGANSPSC